MQKLSQVSKVLPLDTNIKSKKNLGGAILLEKVRDGLPYIKKEDTVFQNDTWLVVLVPSLKIVEAYVTREFKKSHVNSGYDIKDKKERNNLIDKFLSVDGVEIY